MPDRALPDIPGPSGGAKNVESAVLNVISLAHYAIVAARGLPAKGSDGGPHGGTRHARSAPESARRGPGPDRVLPVSRLPHRQLRLPPLRILNPSRRPCPPAIGVESGLG